MDKETIKKNQKSFIGTKLLKKIKKRAKRLEPYYEGITVFNIKGHKHYRLDNREIIKTHNQTPATEEIKQLKNIIENRLESDIRSTIIETNKKQ